MNKKSLREIVTFTRASGATWMNSSGNIIGVDFSSSTVANTAGLKQFVLNSTLGIDRGWIEGDTVIINQQGGSISLSGTVTSYNSTSQNLIVNVTTASGSGSASSWRIGSTVPRRDHEYQGTTLFSKGILIEESRTNSIRNNTMQGAVAGTPGTLPTNWQLYGSAGGLTQTIVGTGTENGITYIDIKYTGATTGTGTNVIYARPESNTQIAALSGQSWTQSAYVRLVGGSLTNVTIAVGVVEYSGAGAALAGSRTTITPTSAGLTTQKYLHTRTLTNASTAFVVGGVEMTFSSSVAIDITLRIGLPQLEQGASATSVIPTTTAAATRSTDVASVNSLSSWYDINQGTFYIEFNKASTPVSDVLYSINDTTANNRINQFVAASRAIATRYVNGGVSTNPSDTSNLITLSATSKAASAYSSSGIVGILNGGTIVAGSAASAPTSVSRIEIGSQNTANFINGHIRRITYYPRRLTNTQLQLITGS